MKTHTKESQNTLTAKKALTILMDGNKRFIQNLRTNRNLLQQVNDTSSGQFPFAVILSCIDSRVPAELIFDQGLGDIFSIRIAGNFINEDILASMEFACKLAGSKLIVVLGHSCCGAISGACDKVKLGNLPGLFQKIQPAIEAVDEEVDRSSANSDFVQKVADKNVDFAINKIKTGSPVLNKMLQQGAIGIVGGMYNVESGEVDFHPMHQGEKRNLYVDSLGELEQK